MGRVHLHLRIRVPDGGREALLAFLRDAIPVYERPGGIRLVLLEDARDPARFVEVVEYADEHAFAADQRRVAEDPQLREHLRRWRALLDGPPGVEVYREAEALREG
jgi:quinol monooxygenase YgiN